MAPIQGTFSLIPDLPTGLNAFANAPGQAAASKPPMTSKQAKKLYKQANKQPKLSKAEQRRIELMEQDRIRKEFEKEKAQARARAARDKKKAKDEEAKAAKKKKGLPLVEVHPSQDTLARFVRGNGIGKKRNSTGENMQLATLVEAAAASEESDKENMKPVGLEAEETSVNHVESAVKGCHGEEQRSEEPRTKRRRTSTPRSPNAVQSLLGTPSSCEEKHLTTVPSHSNDSTTGSSGLVGDIGVSEVRPTLADNTTPAPNGLSKQAHALDKTLSRPSTAASAPSQNKGSTSQSLQTKDKGNAKAAMPHEQAEAHGKNPDLRGISDRTKALKDQTSVRRDQAPKPYTNSQLPMSQLPSHAATSGVLKPLQARSDNRVKACDHTGTIRPGVPGKVPTAVAGTTSTRPSLTTPAVVRTMPPVSRPSPVGGAHTPGYAPYGTVNIPRQKFASPYRPQSMTITSPGPEAMGPPPLPRFRIGNGTSGTSDRPKFLPKSSRTPDACAFEADCTVASCQMPTTPAQDFLPTSTQLFVLSHVDDLFPTPSQELRELSESSEQKLPTDAVMAVPAHRASARLDPTPTALQTAKFDTKETFTSRMPFFSTQDFVLSSQDFLELESETPTRARGQTKATISTSKREYTGADGSKPAGTAPQQPNSGNQETRLPRGSPRSSDSVKDKSQQLPSASASSKQRSTPKVPSQVPTRSRHRPSSLDSSKQSSSPWEAILREAAGPTPVAELAPQPKSPDPPSPPKKRFFTSSGAEAMYLAAERSRKTFQQEQWIRELERRETERREKKETAELQLLAEQAFAEAEEDFIDDEMDGVLQGELLKLNAAEGHAIEVTLRDTQQRDSCQTLSARGHTTLGIEQQQEDGLVESQETDYGDVDFGLLF